MKAKIILIAMLSLFSLTAVAANEVNVLNFIQATLQHKALSTQTLSIGGEIHDGPAIAGVEGDKAASFQGGTYSYRMDINKSFYSSEYDAKKGLRFDQLKEGEVYYFTLSSKDGGKTFKTITFVSKQRPAE